jgi:putative redox protein
MSDEPIGPSRTRRAGPSLAGMTKHISARWTEDGEFEGIDEGGAMIEMSQAAEKFGPSALVLTALAGCTGMDAVSIMTKKRVGFHSYVVDVRGEQRQDHPRIFTSIVVEHIVTGTSIDDKAVARSIELSARKYCVVGASLAAGATVITHRMRITDEQGERTCECLTIGPAGQGLAAERVKRLSSVVGSFP